MTTPTLVQAAPEVQATLEVPDELMIDYDTIITEDDTPVDSILSEKQMRLLTEPLYTAWAGPGNNRPFLALANVGLFYIYNRPPLVPDVMLGLDVRAPTDPRPKRNRSYFVWEYGKPPDVVIEIVSNDEGDEAGRKFHEYAWMGVSYYVIFDPLTIIQDTPLRIFTLHDRQYIEPENGWLPAVKLGLRLWQGVYEGWENTWLRWYDADGNLIPTGAELAAQERQRAELANERATQAEQELATLKARLQAMGIDLKEE